MTDTQILRDPEGKRVDEVSKTPDQVEKRKAATQHFFQAQGPVNVTQKSWATGEVDRRVQCLLRGLRIYLQ